MKENICTIPINDIFCNTSGCPICTMHSMLEKQYVEFITGSAMMAPDVRVQTNKTGFCHKHYKMMAARGPRLSNALILQTHLDEIKNSLLPDKISKPPSKSQLQAINGLQHSCYVCDRINNDINHLIKTVFSQFETDEEFRRIYQKQEYLCLKHYALLISCASQKGGVNKKILPLFYEYTNMLCRDYLDVLYNDVTHFTTMFDYRNQGADWKNSKDSIERSIKFLTSTDIEE